MRPPVQLSAAERVSPFCRSRVMTTSSREDTSTPYKQFPSRERTSQNSGAMRSWQSWGLSPLAVSRSITSPGLA